MRYHHAQLDTSTTTPRLTLTSTPRCSLSSWQARKQKASTMTASYPWLDGDLVIARSVLADIDAHALQEYPNESCGFLTGPATDPKRVDRALRTVNLADKYHKADPETFPRTAQTF